MKKAIGLSLLAAGAGFSSQGMAAQASTEFVRSEVAALRNEFSARLTTLASAQAGLKAQLTALNQGYQEASLSGRVSPGALYQGGLVFYVDETGRHGLVVSLHDLPQSPLEWRNGDSGERITNAHADGLNAGDTNTRLIIAAQTPDNQEGEFAALAAATWRIAADGVSPCSIEAPCYGHWLLPSAYELSLIYQLYRSTSLGDFSEEPYWSSTEASTTEAFLIDFASGERRRADKATPARLRAVHAF
ncbi:DUF1566 domain-containing protein [Legionella tunisiensis]|uniref:DUF1566 domain-containing protein n=1 Tax=Legionella tunisiensis TaxID=1034944 RepID=UPI0002FCA3B9|nr:DUF1566 domain-containing protein [Legionella tunisiensis]